MKQKSLRLIVVIASLIMLTSMLVEVTPITALVTQNNTSWYNSSDTNIASTALGDVNGDGQKEIVTAGYFNDGTHWNAQLSIWNSATLALEKTTSWRLGLDAQLSSVAIGNVTGSSTLDIVVAGSFFDGSRWNAMLYVFNGSAWFVEKSTFWNMGGDTSLASVAIGNATGGSTSDIAVAGSFFDGSRWNALLYVFNGAAWFVEKSTSINSGVGTYFNSVVIGNVTGGGTLDIVIGGLYNDGTRNLAQLIVWNVATLSVGSMSTWFSTSDTEVNSVAIGSLSFGNRVITGGQFWDTFRANAQIFIWAP